MHRVELKGVSTHNIQAEKWQFLMHRVELKVTQRPLGSLTASGS